MSTFVVPAMLHHSDRRKKPLSVSMFIEAENKEDALWQARHGVIEHAASESFPKYTVKYDLRKMVEQKGQA